MTDLQREAREAAREKVSACFGEQHLVEPLDLNAQRAIKAATYSYLAAATPREREIERLRAELAKTKLPIWMLREEHEQEVERLRAELADWQESARKAAGERCEDEIHCCCVPYLRVEIERLRARVAELEEWKSTVPIEDLKELNEWELGFEYPCEAAASISDWLSGQIPLSETKA